MQLPSTPEYLKLHPLNSKKLNYGSLARGYRKSFSLKKDVLPSFINWGHPNSPPMFVNVVKFEATFENLTKPFLESRTIFLQVLLVSDYIFLMIWCIRWNSLFNLFLLWLQASRTELPSTQPDYMYSNNDCVKMMYRISYSFKFIYLTIFLHGLIQLRFIERWWDLYKFRNCQQPPQEPRWTWSFMKAFNLANRLVTVQTNPMLTENIFLIQFN